MKRIFYLSIFIFGIISCASKLETIELRNEDGKVIERFTQHKETKLKEGKLEIYDSDGKILETAHYKNGQLNGLRTVFYENGQAQVVEQYENGIFKGLFKTFYENGALKLEGEYTNGMMNGKWKGYYDSGELKEIVTFVDNEENGPFVEYFKNGKTKTEGNYLDGDNEHGELKMYNEAGDLVRKMDCNKGVCRTIWKSENEQNE